MKLSILLTAVVAALAGHVADASKLASRGTKYNPTLPIGGHGQPHLKTAPKQQLLQNIVTWDEHSFFVRGERVMLFSGEVHPFRLPSPSLYLDVFQKIKALGLNTVSFYVDWALVEGKQGNFQSSGTINDLEPFFDAASQAGIYLLARPGPYINAEVSGGGFPGWLQRINGILRTPAPSFLSATDNYMAKICSIIAKYQITNGGPIILFQPENEYSSGSNGITFPDGDYMQYIIDQARKAGVVVPLISNDSYNGGNNAPGTGNGSVDVYGYDGYPLGFDCGSPTTWPVGQLPIDYYSVHENESPTTPHSIVEFQGGAYDPPGGWGFEQCAALVNQEFERVFYKNDVASGITFLSLYMIFGGSNWGYLGHPNGYSSYDYGAVIREDRQIDREKYSELKLEAQFLKVSPDYLTTIPGEASNTTYSTNRGLTVTPLEQDDSASHRSGNGSFFIVRHADYSSTATVHYKLHLPVTPKSTLTIPQLGGQLTLSGRDSKIHVVNYRVGDYNMLYSTAEVFTWKKFQDRTVLVLYGGPKEMHELAIEPQGQKPQLIGEHAVMFNTVDNSLVFQWNVSPKRQVIKVGDLYIYLVDRNTAYNYWVPELPGKGSNAAYGTSVMNPDALIVSGAYFIRGVSVKGSTVTLSADFNSTSAANSNLEIIGVPKSATNLVLNGSPLSHTTNSLGNWVASPSIYIPQSVSLPNLSTAKWSAVNSLPEILKQYDDSLWPVANHTKTNNTVIHGPLRTDVCLYGAEYGFNTGTLVFRGHFTAKGTETQFQLWTEGGQAFASSVWLDDQFVGSFQGFDAAEDHQDTYNLPFTPKRGSKHVFTILVESNGLDENLNPGNDNMKEPRGILDYKLSPANSSDEDFTRITTWKITGNLGGEDYQDHFRGPLNEGGLFFERQGYHLPKPPQSLPQIAASNSRSPYDGISEAGVVFYHTSFNLDISAKKYDIPLTFNFDNGTDAGHYRALLYVNGFQFGKYMSNVGPQTSFPVPEGILNYNGVNWLGLGVWALEKGGAKVPGFSLKAGQPVQTSRTPVKLVNGPSYAKRANAY